ncbi:hypothetical protein LJR296_001457 [Cupriavidus necator]|uniref:hyaluronate lyase N-terminal domain-containing protein n=1 Tax=Cupriavidus necator TaxID=106590 RepID=UPI003ECD5FF8
MSNALKLRRGTAAQHASFTGAQGEVTVDTDSGELRVHDGATAGGKATMSRAALADATQGSTLVGYLPDGAGASATKVSDQLNGLQLESVAKLIGLTGKVGGHRVQVASYLSGWAGTTAGPRGGGGFVWDGSKPKSSHNGISVISPTVPWNGAQATLGAFLAGTGETAPGGNGCWRRIFEKLDPYMAGAVGDGTTVDTAAFKAWVGVCNAMGKAFAQVLDGEYKVNDSFNFDLDYLDLYLSSGARIFSTQASSNGHLMGIIGHVEAGEAGSPTRAFARIHGSGRVDAWSAGGNENGIGIMRYDMIIVDGVTATGGNKGLTAQYGIGKARFLNVKVPTAGFRGITVEDQVAAPDVIIEGCEVGVTGDVGILAAGARVAIRRCSVDQAHTTSGSSSLGAVQINTTGTLLYAEADKIRVGAANTGHGMVISSAQDGRISNIDIGSSTGSAVEIYNSQPIEVGSVHAPNSPNGVATTGSTPSLRRIAYDDRALDSGEETLPRLHIINTALSLPSGTMRLAYFTARKTEQIANVRIPCGNTAAGATPTLIRVGIYSVAANGDLTLIAATTSDTTLMAVANTVYTKALSASFVKRGGQRYAVGLLVVTGAATPTTIGTSGAGNITSEYGKSPKLCGSVASQTDLPASLTAASVAEATALPYLVLAP